MGFRGVGDLGKNEFMEHFKIVEKSMENVIGVRFAHQESAV